MWNHIVFVATMALAGIIGGAASYLLSSPSKGSPPVFKDRDFYKAVSIGLVASFLVPLFLQLISSNLIDNTLADDKLNFNSLLILASYCLIVAISSRKFIEMITNSTLDKLNTKVDSLSGDVATIRDAHTEDGVEPGDSTDATTQQSEPENDTDNTGTNGTLHATGIGGTAGIIGKPVPDTDALPSPPTLLHSLPPTTNRPLQAAPPKKTPQLSPSDNARYQVLKALTSSTYLYRSIDGVRSDAGLPESTVNETLRQLLGEKLVAQSFSTQGTRFNITPTGRERLTQYNG